MLEKILVGAVGLLVLFGSPFEELEPRMGVHRNLCAHPRGYADLVRDPVR